MKNRVTKRSRVFIDLVILNMIKYKVYGYSMIIMLTTATQQFQLNSLTKKVIFATSLTTTVELTLRVINHNKTPPTQLILIFNQQQNMFQFLSLLTLSYLGLGSSSTIYWVSLKTSSLTDSGTDSSIYITILGKDGYVTSELETSGHNDFLAGEVDEYEFTREDDIGEVVGAEITTGGSDGFLFDWVNVRSSGDSKNRFLYLYNTDKQWLSRDSDEGVRGVRLYPQVNK